MFLKNLFRRKVRTLLTILGISIGVSAIIALGALAEGLDTGYGRMLTGSKADLVLSQPDAYDLSFSAVDEALGAQLAAAPEVSQVSGMLEGFAQSEGEPFFFVFGHPLDSFALERYQIIAGLPLTDRQVQKAHGAPIIIGSAASEVLDKDVGDSMRLVGSTFRIVGIYQTGDAFEDSGAVMELKDAQQLLGRARQVSVFYIRLKDPALKERFLKRVERQWPDLALSGAQELADKQTMADMLRGYVWAIGGLAIIIGGVGMMNSQLMSVMERTREIGTLRSLGWSKARVLFMILGEAIFVSLFGGALGVALGWLMISALARSTVVFGLNTQYIQADEIIQAFVVVLVLGLFGGLYPAWRASRLLPAEALRYEGGSSGERIHRLPVGGMAVQSLWQRTTRTLLTLGMIGLTVGAIMAIQGVIDGAMGSMDKMFTDAHVEIMLRQANVSDTGLSAIDERVGERIAAMPEVQSVSGIIFTAVVLPDAGSFFVLMGYQPGSLPIQRLKILEGQSLTTNHQILLGKMMADGLKKGVGDTIELSGVRFRVVGIFESSATWEEMGGAITLRDAQSFMGRPRSVSMLAVKVRDPDQAAAIVEKINQQFPEVHAALAGEFLEQMPDRKTSQGMLDGISLLAILVGGVGVLNTMLMAVFERTREIGVLRALGWRRSAILGLILREALILGLLGGAAGIGLAFILAYLLGNVPMIGQAFAPLWQPVTFVRAILIALLLGALGGLYPAYRATRLQPVEALRYE